MDLKDRAERDFDGGFNCAQAILAAAAPTLGMDRDTALGVAGGFGGGMGRLGEVCGAVTGAFMAIGMVHGKRRQEDEGARERTYALVAAFARRFRERHGSILCRELLHLNLSTAEGRAEADRRKVHGTVCAGLVVSAAEMLEQMLKEER